MTNKLIYGLLVVMVVAFACAAPTADTTTDVQDSGTDDIPENQDSPDGEDVPFIPTDVAEEPSETGDDSEPDVTFHLTGENFAFFMDDERSPTLTVQQGDLVRIEFESTDGFHDWVLDEFGASTSRVRETDGVTTVEFVADQSGTFEYYCSVGSHRANGMFGTFIVE